MDINLGFWRAKTQGTRLDRPSLDSSDGARTPSSMPMMTSISQPRHTFCPHSASIPPRWDLASLECPGEFCETLQNQEVTYNSADIYRNTAWFGFKTICQPKAGETVVVTGAAGAVGSLVGQLAKAEGCTVVGLAGDDAKCEWLRTLGFDHAINYKTANVAKALREAAPNGFDSYFDNVGGDLSSTILTQMKDFGRVAVCGAISAYNAEGTPEQQPALQSLFVFKQLKMEGFLVWRWADRWLEGIESMYKLVEAGKIQYQETTTEGFENMPKAFISMLRGGNTGKAIVKASL